MTKHMCVVCILIFETFLQTADQLTYMMFKALVLQALSDYCHVCQVLRGDSPNKGILGNCPPGYLASRISAFAADSCCKAFSWKGGGGWMGRDWSADLPTDTHVLLYLLGAFLSAPFWIFEVCQNML